MKRRSSAIFAVAAAAAIAASSCSLAACKKTEATDDGVYTITFDGNGGAFAQGTTITLTTENGLLASMPDETPAYTGKVFNGYNLKSDGSGVKVTVETVFTEDTTVYAQWTSNGSGQETPDGKFTVTFDGNGGKFDDKASIQSETTNGRLAALPEKDPVRANYTFNGYNIKQDGTGALVTRNTVFTADTTVYAQWTGNGGGQETPSGAYIVTFDPNGGELADGAASSMTTANGKLTGALPGVKTRAGYVFGGWNLKADGTGATVDTSTVFESNTEVFAKWTATGGVTEDVCHYIVGGNKVALTDNGKPEHDSAEKELMATGIALAGGAEVSFEINGAPLDFILDARSHGVKKAGDKIVVKAAGGTYDIYLRYYAATATDPACWTVEMNDGVVEETKAYYLVGDVNDWAFDSGYKLTAVELDAGETHLKSKFMIGNVQLAANTSFKIKYNPGAGESEIWYAGLETDYVDATIATGGGYGEYAPNIDIVTSGTYDIYLKFGKDDIHSIYIGSAGGGDHGGEEEVDTGTASFSVGGGAAVGLTNNTANIPPEHKAKREFMKEGVALEADDVLSFTVDGKPLTAFNLAGESHGVTKVANGLKVLETGNFNIYVRFYKADNEEPNDRWVIEMTDGKTEDVGELVEGDYYLVGSMNGWSPKEAYHIGANGATIKLFEGQTFKIAKNKEGATDWASKNYGYGDVTVGAGYVSRGDGGNIVIDATATYTVKLNGTNVEITSTEIDEPEVLANSATFIFTDGTVIIQLAYIPSWGDEGSAYAYDGGAWDSRYALNGSTYTINKSKSEVSFMIGFMQGDGGKNTASIACSEFVNDKINIVSNVNGSGDEFTWNGDKWEYTLTQQDRS